VTLEQQWREHAPAWLRRCLRPILRPYARRRWNAEFRNLGTKETFERIYDENHWGTPDPGSIYSGEGSTSAFATHYRSLLEPQLLRHRITSLADLGCGDFQIGATLSPLLNHYTGVDVVSRVVAANQRLHANDRCQFLQADICTDPLPSADAAIVRQVLQHLSNAEIRAALDNILPRYPIVFITEHIDIEPGSEPNIDIPHGPSVRADVGSGVWIDQEPFNVPATVLGDIPFKRTEVLRTWMVDTEKYRGRPVAYNR